MSKFFRLLKDVFSKISDSYSGEVPFTEFLSDEQLDEKL